MTPRTALAAAAALSAASGAAYWTTLSSQSQLLGRFPDRGDGSDPPRIALTFDDGPNEPFTGRLAAMLESRAVRATFFQVGRAVMRTPEVSRALLGAGHVIGNHSCTHRFARCFGERSIEDEVARAQDIFADELSVRPALFRPPWLARTRATFRVLRRHGLTAVSGTFCHPLEVMQIHHARIARRAAARARPGSMIIFHDGYNGTGADRARTIDAVARLIDTIGERGWGFATVDELLGVPAYRPIVGVSACGSQS